MQFNFNRPSGKLVLGIYSVLFLIGEVSLGHAMMVSKQKKGQKKSVALSSQPSLSAVVDSPRSEESLEIHRSSSFTYSIVSEGNCTATLPNGSLRNCRFPEIQLEEHSLGLPPLPYETAVRVKVSRSCILPRDFHALQMRLGKYGDGQGGPAVGAAQSESSDFLKYEILSLGHSQTVILENIHQAPLGSLKIVPPSSDIFLESEFPRGCEIEVQVDLNRIALRTEEEAKAYLARLEDQCKLIRASYDALSVVASCRDQRHEVAGIIAGMEQIAIQNQRGAQNCQLQWADLKQILPELKESIDRNGAFFPEMSELMESMSDFDEILSQSLAVQKAAPQQFSELLSPTQQSRLELTGERITDLLHNFDLAALARRATDAELQMAGVKRTLHAYFSHDQVYPRLMEDLRDELDHTVSGSGGTIDQFIHGLYQVGKTSH